MKTAIVLALMAVFVLQPAIVRAQESEADIEQRAVALLLKGAADKEPTTRQQSVIAASMIGPHEKVVQFLVSKLDDEDVPVRVTAIASLVDVGGTAGLPALEKALNSDVPEVAFAAAKGLYTLDQESGRRVLLAVARGDENAKSNFVESQKRGVLRQLKTPKSTFLFAFRSGAGFIPVPGLGAGIAASQALMNDAEFSGPASALLMLAKENGPEIEQLANAALADKEWSVRAVAVQIYASSGKSERRSDLVPLFEDKKEQVRFRAAAAYIRLALASRLKD